MNKLQQLRKEKNLTQQELSTMSCIQLNTIKALEQGISSLLNAKASTVMALAIPMVAGIKTKATTMKIN